METNSDSTFTSDATAASSIVNLYMNEVNKQDVNGLLQVQNSLYVYFCFVKKNNIHLNIFIRLDQLDKTSEKLDGINKLSAQRYLDATKDFTNHTQMLTTMKTDLDLIFKRIKYNKKKQTNSICFSL